MRQDWDNYFLDLCEQISTRSTCDRLKVGSVLVKDRRIISTGYNGSLPGQPHCDNEGHLLEENHCVRVVHSEVNAIAQAARFGIATEGTNLYCNYLPCWNCLKVILSAGVKDVIYRHTYKPNSRCVDHPAVRRARRVGDTPEPSPSR